MPIFINNLFKNFNEITTLFILILKITRIFNRLIFKKNNSAKLVFKKNNDNYKFIRFGISNDSIEFAKKLRKLKSQKFSKFQKTFKFKKLSKSRNLSKIDTKKVGSNFLISNAKIIFNNL